MGRARGSDATMQLAFETSYGTPPTTGYLVVPFVSSSLGATRPLIESDLLGQGRNPFDPVADATTNDGDVVVPIDELYFGLWLRMLLGDPTTTGSAPGPYTHVFNNLGEPLQSTSVAIGHPKVPSYSVNYGVKANSLSVSQQRTGLLNATIGCVAKGETTPGATTAIDPAGPPSAFSRFVQVSGSVELDGVVLGGVVDGNFSYSNALDKIETIRPDGEIEDADPGMPMASGQARLRFADHALLNKAIAGTPVAITHKWTAGAFSIAFTFPRVFLPRPKRSIDGPGGVMAAFDWQGSGRAGELMRVTLVSSAPGFFA